MVQEKTDDINGTGKVALDDRHHNVLLITQFTLTRTVPVVNASGGDIFYWKIQSVSAAFHC